MKNSQKNEHDENPDGEKHDENDGRASVGRHPGPRFALPGFPLHPLGAPQGGTPLAAVPGAVGVRVGVDFVASTTL